MKKWERIFVISNIFIIIIIIGIYVYRGFYYYRDMYVVNNDNNRLVDNIINSKNVVYHDDGLYKIDDDNYYYRGMDVDNYVYYSGRLWRIIGIDNTGIKLITDSNQSSLIWDTALKYDESMIYDWLNNIFLDTIDKENIVLGKYCNSLVDMNSYECNEFVESLVGLLSFDEYKRALSKDSYLNNNTYFWLVNKSLDDKAMYVHNNGGVNDDYNHENTYYSYGIRPVIYLNKDINYYDGNGSYNNPYIIKNKDEEVIGKYEVGSYLIYNDYVFRIMEQGSNYTKIIMDGILPDIKLGYNDGIKYLNHEFLDGFNKDELVKIDYSMNLYSDSNKYDYLSSVSKNNDYVGLARIGEMFATGYNSFLSSYLNVDNKLVYTSMDDGEIYGDLISNSNALRPVMAIKNDLLIYEGNGTKSSPLVVGDIE